MAEQQLDGTQVGAGFQQVNGERVAQGMRATRLVDAARADLTSRQVRSMVSGETGWPGSRPGNSHSPGWVRFQ